MGSPLAKLEYWSVIHGRQIRLRHCILWTSMPRVRYTSTTKTPQNKFTKFSTRNQELSGNNGQYFAKLVCKNLGFTDMSFMGLKDDYYKFAQQNNIKIDVAKAKAAEDCIPEYKIAGGVCNKTTTGLNAVSENPLNQMPCLPPNCYILRFFVTCSQKYD